MSRVKLKDFDLMGILEISFEELDKSLREFVTATNKNTYLSRSNLFWRDLSGADAINIRNYLKNSILSNNLKGKNAFIALDYMSNISGKTYYKLCEDFVNGQCNIADVLQAKLCLYDDIKNIVSLIENGTYDLGAYELPQVNGILPTRNIECNNMALLYIFSKSLIPPPGYNVLNTGLGGVFIGPFFKTIYGVNWSNILKSKYVSTNVNKTNNSIIDLIVEKDVFNNNKVFFLDDNVGTGSTMIEIKNEFEKLGYETKCGAVQYNWINYYRVASGEKDIDRFNPANIDYVTLFNYPGHKLLEHVINIFNGTMNSNGEIIEQINSDIDISNNYAKYKERKHYYGQDIETLQEKSRRYASMAGFNILDDNDKYNSQLTDDTIHLINNISNITKRTYESDSEKSLN
mgnify:CR=1 FL=1